MLCGRWMTAVYTQIGCHDNKGLISSKEVGRRQFDSGPSPIHPNSSDWSGETTNPLTSAPCPGGQSWLPLLISLQPNWILTLALCPGLTLIDTQRKPSWILSSLPVLSLPHLLIQVRQGQCCLSCTDLGVTVCGQRLDQTLCNCWEILKTSWQHSPQSLSLCPWMTHPRALAHLKGSPRLEAWVALTPTHPPPPPLHWPPILPQALCVSHLRALALTVCSARMLSPLALLCLAPSPPFRPYFAQSFPQRSLPWSYCHKGSATCHLTPT